MTICLVLISGGWGGAENMVHNLAEQLNHKGENVIILLNSEVAKYFSNLKNVKIFEMASLYNFKALIISILFSKRKKIAYEPIWNSGPFYLLNEVFRYVYYKRIHKNVLQILSEEKVDIVLLHLVDSLKLFRGLLEKLSLPVVFTIHGSHVPKGLMKVDKIICVSEYTRNVLKYSDASLFKKSVVIPNGINISGIRKTSKITLKGNFKLLFPGGKKIFKGGDLLIKSLPGIKKEILDVHLYFAGDVPKGHTLRKLARDMKVEHNISFLGFLPAPKYHKVLFSTDLLVLPSKMESFGVVLLEAMALGKPVIATKVGGIPELVKDAQNGIFVERNPESLKNAIVFLYKNKDIYEQISQNNLLDAEAFDWNSIIEKHIELYKTRIARHNKVCS